MITRPVTYRSPLWWVQRVQGQLVTGGAQGLQLPPMGYAMDPSDPRTWRRPVVFT